MILKGWIKSNYYTNEACVCVFIPEIRIFWGFFFNSLPQDGAVLQGKHLSELVPAEVDETLRDLQDVCFSKTVLLK